MTGIGILFVVFLLIAAFVMAKDNHNEHTAFNWISRNDHSLIWTGTLGLKPLPENIRRKTNTTLLHIVVSETPRTYVVFEVYESFPILNHGTQVHVIERLLDANDCPKFFDRFYTGRELFVH